MTTPEYKDKDEEVAVTPALAVEPEPKVIEASWVEFRNRTGSEFRYEPLIGNRKPALNYRD